MRSIRARLFVAFLALAFVPLAISGGLLVWQSYATHVASIYAHQRDLAARIAVELDVFFRGVEERLRRVDLLRDVSRLPAEEQAGIVAALVAERHDFRELALIDETGRERARAAADEPVLAADLRDRRGDDAYRWPALHGETWSSPVHYDRTTGEPLMTMAVPLVDRRTGRTRAVLAGVVRVRPAWNIVSVHGLRPGRSVYLIDADGRLVAHPNPSLVLREARLERVPTEGMGRGPGGEWAYFVARDYRVGQQPMKVVAEYTVAEALKPARRHMASVAGVILLSLLPVTALFWYSVRRFIRPVEAVSAAARAIRGGDLARRAQATTDDEIGDLALSFNAMSDDIQAAMERQRQALRDIEDLYNGAPCGYHSLSADGTFLRINDTELAWLGYAREELLGQKRFEDLLTAEGRRTFEQNFPRFKEQGWIRDLEFDLVRKDGSLLPVLLSATAVRDAQGNFVMSRSTLYDITDRRAAERRVLALNQELERRVAERTKQLETANRELESFAYSVSHDLRAPLRAIDGFSRIVLDDYGGQLDAEGQRLLGVVRTNARRMSDLIDDILNFSRMSRREMAVAPVDLASLAKSVFAELQADAPGRRLRLVLGELPPAPGDAALLRQVLFNLLSNAVKFTATRPEAVIEIGGQAAGEENIYYVRDNGVGFDMAYAEKLFGVFQRLHTNEEFEGTGIGLAIVKRIVERHGGRVWAESQVDQGATFRFALPCG